MSLANKSICVLTLQQERTWNILKNLNLSKALYNNRKLNWLVEHWTHIYEGYTFGLFIYRSGIQFIGSGELCFNQIR